MGFPQTGTVHSRSTGNLEPADNSDEVLCFVLSFKLLRLTFEASLILNMQFYQTLMVKNFQDAQHSWHSGTFKSLNLPLNEKKFILHDKARLVGN